MKTIQEILDEERKKSGISEKTNHEVAMTVQNSIRSLDPEIHDRKSKTLKEKYQDPEYSKQHKNLIQAITKTDEWKEAHAIGMTKRKLNGWAEKNQAARKTKRIQTPHGIFESKKAAIEAMTNLNIGNAGGKLSVWLKSRPDEYYYIDK